MPKVSQTKLELEKALNEELELLAQLSELYDNGSQNMAKLLATTVRVLVHDTKNSKSLLAQLGVKQRKFLTTAETVPASVPGILHVGNFAALIGISLGGPGPDYVPYFDTGPRGSNTWIDFDEYWNETVFIDKHNEFFSRKDVVLYLANQDGGAHIDPKLDKKYVELSRHNSLGWQAGDIPDMRDLKGAELAAMRQISHEILTTLKEDYVTPQVKPSPYGVIGAGGIRLVTSEGHPNANDSVKTQFSGVRRKDPCPCGSGKKYKRCHGN